MPVLDQNMKAPEPTSPADWQLWRHSAVTGRDKWVDSGREKEMRARMADLAAGGAQTWLVAPNGDLHPSQATA